MTPEEQIERAEQARAFKEYYEANPYLASVLARERDYIIDTMVKLQPHAQINFTILKAQLDSINDFMGIVNTDIYFGQKALEKLQGVEQQEGGIL